jgi:hypothetical protein
VQDHLSTLIRFQCIVFSVDGYSVEAAAMKLITHNMLACHIKGHRDHQDVPLKIEATKVICFISCRSSVCIQF